MQAALVRIWRKLPTLRDPAGFESWSYRILVHACYAEAQGARRGDVRMTVDRADDSDGIGAVHDRDELERAFRRLSIDQRTIIVLRHYLDLAPEAVAETLGVPVGTVHSRLHRTSGCRTGQA